MIETNMAKIQLEKEIAGNLGGLDNYFRENQVVYYVCVNLYETEQDFYDDYNNENLFFSSGDAVNKKFGVDERIETELGAIRDKGESYFSNKKNARKMSNILNRHLMELGYDVTIVGDLQ